MSFLTQPITLQSLFGQNRRFGDIEVQVVVTENTNDSLTITRQPVQTGAAITDHAFKEPTSFSMQILFLANTLTGNTLQKIYSDLIDLQLKREPMDIVTPKRIYHNMLIATLGQTTNKDTENILSINLTFQEVIIVSTIVVEVDRTKQRSPGKTQATQKSGPKSLLKLEANGANGVADSLAKVLHR